MVLNIKTLYYIYSMPWPSKAPTLLSFLWFHLSRVSSAWSAPCSSARMSNTSSPCGIPQTPHPNFLPASVFPSIPNYWLYLICSLSTKLLWASHLPLHFHTLKLAECVCDRGLCSPTQQVWSLVDQHYFAVCLLILDKGILLLSWSACIQRYL